MFWDTKMAMRKGLMSRVKRGIYDGLAAGALGLSLLGLGCRDATGPKIEPPPVKTITQTLTLQGFNDLYSNISLQNVPKATRIITKDGVQQDSLTRTITTSSYSDTLTNRDPGKWCSILSADSVKPDTVCAVVPKDNPMVYTGTVPKLYAYGDTATVTLDSIVSQNPRIGTARTMTGVASLDGKVIPTLTGNQMKITSTDSLGNYSIAVSGKTVTGTVIQGVFRNGITPDVIALSITVPGIAPSQIYKVNSDGTGLQNITNTTSQDMTPAWSPDATMITFESNRFKPLFSVYTMESNGNNQTRLISTDLYTSYPSWFPNNEDLTFAYTNYLNKAGVGRIKKNGTGFTSLSEWTYSGPVSVPANLVVSPDGTEIAFSIYNQVYTINSNGSITPTLFTNNPSINGEPRFVPDGSGIIFVSNRDNPNFDLYKQDFQGNVTRITTTGGVLDPDILQNGKKIIYTKYNSSQLYFINVDGTGKTDTLTVIGDTRFPTFRSRVR